MCRCLLTVARRTTVDHLAILILGRHAKGAAVALLHLQLLRVLFTVF